MKYKCIENASIDGKFGGYTVTPEEAPKTSYTIAKYDVPIKYDENKSIDKVKSNNGIDH